MCGIIAMYSKTEPVRAEVIERALPALEHRGPDERHTWVAKNGRLGLGHTRLSIIGLQNGRQPLTTEDEKIYAVVNGEFYGFEAIRQELIGQGHRFQTESDSEILVHLFEEMGPACLHKLRGEFACVLWDEKNETLFAARDRFGIKPLYYARVQEKIYLASEIKALLAMGVEAKWDQETQFQMHAGSMIASRTLFSGVYAVPPGHYLLMSRGELKVIPYWDFDYPRIEDRISVPSFEEAVVQVRAQLQESIRLRMRSDVPVGVYLSGGIDSCTILGFASQMAKTPLRAFTLCFTEADYNEAAIAQEMAAHAGAEYCPIEITAQDLADNLEGALISAETLFNNGNGIGKYLLSRTVNRAGYKVVLTGEGSDEIFGGYAPFKKDMILQGTDSRERDRLLAELDLTNSVSKGVLLARESGPGSESLMQALGFVPSHIDAFLSGAVKSRPFLSESLLGSFRDRDAVRVFLNEVDIRRQLQGREPLHQSMYLWSKTVLPLFLLTVLGDRMEMAHSVEGRVPFLDHKLVEMLVRLPASYKINGLTEKYILREAAKPVITETIYRRQKHPFLAPPSSALSGKPLEQFIQDTLRGTEGLNKLSIYNKSEALKLLDKLPTLSPDARASADPLLMMMVSNAVLRKNFRITD